MSEAVELALVVLREAIDAGTLTGLQELEVFCLGQRLDAKRSGGLGDAGDPSAGECEEKSPVESGEGRELVPGERLAVEQYRALMGRPMPYSGRRRRKNAEGKWEDVEG